MLRRSGNPVLSPSFKALLKKLKKQSSHEVKGANQFIPQDVRGIRDCLCNSNSVVDLQTYTLLLQGICLFERHDELGRTHSNDFQPNLHGITEHAIHSLALSLSGKCDYKDGIRSLKFMSIPRNDETPDFCTIRHLLPYIFVAGIKGGYIFPTEAKLLNPPSDVIFKTFYRN